MILFRLTKNNESMTKEKLLCEIESLLEPEERANPMDALCRYVSCNRSIEYRQPLLAAYLANKYALPSLDEILENFNENILIPF